MTKHIYIFVVLSFFLQSTHALIVGSETVPSRESFIAFPGTDTNNEIRGFAWLTDGFSLADMNSTCTYNGVFPVLGNVILNGGTFYLNRDLSLSGSGSSFVGSVFGYDHILDIGVSVTAWSTVINSISGAFTLIDSIVLGDEPRSVDWRAGDAHLAAGKKTGIENELEGFSFDGTTIVSVDSVLVSEDINSLRWHPTADRLATVQKQTVGFPELRIWSFNPITELFTQADSAENATDLEAVAWRPQGDHIAIGGRGPNVDVYPVDGIGTLGVIINADINPTDRPNRNAIEWDDSGNYFAVGARQGLGTELLVYYFDGTTLTLTVSAHLGDRVLGVSWSPTGTFIAVGIRAGVTETLRVYEHHVWDGTLIENTAARIGEIIEVQTVDWSSDGNSLAVGRKTAAGSDIFIYSFNKSAVTLTELFSADAGIDVNDIRWSHDDAYIVVGLASNAVDVYSVSVARTETTNSALFDSTHIFLNNDFSIDVTTSFQNTCTIDGQNQTVNLGSQGSIVSAGNLILKNLRLTNVENNNLRCVSGDNSIMLQDAQIELSGDFSFTTGSFLFDKQVVFSGTNVFAYESSNSSTINSNSDLVFDRDMTFSYAPSTANQELIVFNDTSAQMHFIRSTLFVTSTGLKLTKGKLVIESYVNVASDATVKTEGIILGDGSNSANDLELIFFPGATLDLGSGFLVNNNAAQS